MSTNDALAARTTRTLDLLAQLEAATARLREAQIECARILREVFELDEGQMLGCATPGELGERVAIPAAEARELFDFGRAMKHAPYVEDQVRKGRITVAAAACVGQVLSDPALQRPEDDWVGWAQTESTKAMRRRVQRRKEEARLAGEEALPLTVFVPQRVREAFAQARVVASRKASRALTPGETFATVVDHYLDTFDPDRVAPGDRRAPHTSIVGGRYVPAAVRREVYERQRGGCAVPFCDNVIFVEMAHLVPHACGGHREADNLVLLCSVHHAFFDLGWITLRGTADQPQFFDSAGHDLARRFDPVTPPERPPPSPPGAGPPSAPDGADGPPSLQVDVPAEDPDDRRRRLELERLMLDDVDEWRRELRPVVRFPSDDDGPTPVPRPPGAPTPPYDAVEPPVDDDAGANAGG